MKAAVFGLGQMGRGIAVNLHRAGHLVGGWDVLERARDALPPDVPRLLPRQLAEVADVLLFVVPSSVEIEACLDDLLDVSRPGQVLVDLTTSRPADTIRIAARASAAGRSYLDGGMSGGALGADAGRLTLMMGGDAEVLQSCRPLLEVIAAKVFHLGDVGAGHTMKLVHNMVCHTNFLALVEGCRMAERTGLALPAVIDVINAGNARSYVSEARFPNHILSGRFDGRSTVANLAKDLRMAAEMAEDAPYTELTSKLLDRAVADGYSLEDFTKLYELYDHLR